MSLPQAPDESVETSFWAAVYTEEPPHVLNLHRFTLHQHITTHESLTETPIWHQPFHDALPPPLQRILQRYHINLNLATVHLRRALDALDLLGRQPPAAYIRDPDLAAGDLPPPTETPFPAASALQPGSKPAFPPLSATNSPPTLHGRWFSSTPPRRRRPHTLPHIRRSKPTL